jgi:hypothetical protein
MSTVSQPSVVIAQILTFAIPIGTLTLVVILGFFQRRPSR